ncbi:hypothetical protein [Polymorphospora sp. NPDC050346]|uniref:hypothetical protein n=1 Tax=Polymorphospora sp. NPDC050346 TaxID=3155780 RepID=UPI0033DAE7F4
MRGLLTEEEARERDIAARARRIAAEVGSEEMHRARVRKCSGLSIVILQCHLDTWQFALRAMSGPWLLQGRWTEDPSSSITRTTNNEDDSPVRVRLSGARLSELMSVLWYLPTHRRSGHRAPVGMEAAWKSLPTPVEEDKAARLYLAIAAVIDRVEVNTPRQTDYPVVIIDDAIAGDS